MMNILDEEDNSREPINRVKAFYLQVENNQMTLQYNFLDGLIQSFKQIIQITHSQKQKADIQKVQQKVQESITNRISDCLKQNKVSIQNGVNIDQEEFQLMAINYLQKIQKLQADIHHRQKKLQCIEDQKLRAQNFSGNFQKNGERNNSLKCLYNSDIYTKILNQVKKQALILKVQKKKLEQKLLKAHESKSVAQIQEITQSTNSCQKDSKNKQNLQESKQQFSSRASNLSTFQKLVLLLKKKQYENSILEQRIKQKMLKIEKKQSIAKSILKSIENIECCFIDNIQHSPNGYVQNLRLFDNDLSLLSKTITHNNDVSFNISRFIVASDK